MNEIKLINKGNEFRASSLEIAKNFKKEHAKVTRDIERLINEITPEVAISYFILDTYKDSMNRSQIEYLMTRDGFSLLVMGFTGKKALQWKMRYIEVFNNMEKELKESNMDSFMIEDKIKRAEVWMREQKVVQLLEQQNKELFEEVQVNQTIIDTIMKDADLRSIFLVGKVLKPYNPDFGAKKIYSYLREINWLITRRGSQLNNTPFDIHHDKFEVKLIGNNIITYFNKKGLKCFLNKVIRDGLILKSDKQKILVDIENEVKKNN